jgi:DNA excision repair protein ERCC-1
VWEIELDDEPTSPSIPTVNFKDSVVFDIDLDLN